MVPLYDSFSRPGKEEIPEESFLSLGSTHWHTVASTGCTLVTENSKFSKLTPHGANSSAKVVQRDSAELKQHTVKRNSE